MNVQILGVLQKTQNEPISQSYSRYFYSHNRRHSAAIVLGDFGADGFRMPHARYNLSLGHARCAFAAIGRLHGRMYAAKAARPERFDAWRGALRQSRFIASHTSPQWDRRLRIGPQRAAQAVRNDAATRELVPEAFLVQLVEALADPYRYQQRVTQRQREPLAVLCHGDFLRNNVAFRYADGVDDKEVSCCWWYLRRGTHFSK